MFAKTNVIGLALNAESFNWLQQLQLAKELNCSLVQLMVQRQALHNTNLSVTQDLIFQLPTPKFDKKNTIINKELIIELATVLQSKPLVFVIKPGDLKTYHPLSEIEKNKIIGHLVDLILSLMALDATVLIENQPYKKDNFGHEKEQIKHLFAMISKREHYKGQFGLALNTEHLESFDQATIDHWLKEFTNELQVVYFSIMSDSKMYMLLEKLYEKQLPLLLKTTSTDGEMIRNKYQKTKEIQEQVVKLKRAASQKKDNDNNVRGYWYTEDILILIVLTILTLLFLIF